MSLEQSQSRVRHSQRGVNLKKVADNRKTWWPWNPPNTPAKTHTFVPNEVKEEKTGDSEKEK
jgi:hypothetical protein